ncbi:unnamed protein product, partial [Meganyctiphanes norvegica]
MAEYTIVMVRHGESEFNKLNKFTGWCNVNLTEKGVMQARKAGQDLKKSGYTFDKAYTSVLNRAIKTLDYILEEVDQTDLLVEKSWRLNEMHTGNPTGCIKSEVRAEYGVAQVKTWNRGYNNPPPAMTEEHPYHDLIINDPAYSEGPAEEEFPMVESLKNALDRALPYWNDVIIPSLSPGDRVLIVAHSNLLRGIIKYLNNISDNDIVDLNLPNGVPFVYKLDQNHEPIVSMKFLGETDYLPSNLRHKIVANGVI